MSAAAAAPPAFMLTPAELAEKLGESELELARMRTNREGPAYIQLTRRTVRYLAVDVEDWLTKTGIRHRPGQ